MWKTRCLFQLLIGHTFTRSRSSQIPIHTHTKRTYTMPYKKKWGDDGVINVFWINFKSGFQLEKEPLESQNRFSWELSFKIPYFLNSKRPESSFQGDKRHDTIFVWHHTFLHILTFYYPDSVLLLVTYQVKIKMWPSIFIYLQPASANIIVLLHAIMSNFVPWMREWCKS